MNFSSEIKAEILSAPPEQPCCRIAFLSAFIRTSGSLKLRGNKLGFEVTTESRPAAELVGRMLKETFGLGIKVLLESEDKLNHREKIVFECVNDRSAAAMTELGFVEPEEGGPSFVRGIGKYLVENECCRREYVRGAFLGGGSCTVPRETGDEARPSATGYHLEFTFGVYEAASDFAELLAVYDIFPKLIARKESFVVYLKSNESIGDALALMGASASALRLADLVVVRDVKNNVNRQVNCEMGNLTKQIDASVRQIEAIRLIYDLPGPDALGEDLRRVADLRLAEPGLTLGGLAERLGESKSCINHRMRRIMEIAADLGGKET